MPGTSGPSSEWPLTVSIETPTVSMPDRSESFYVHWHTGDMALTVRGHKDDVNRIYDAIRPVLAEWGMLASGGTVRP